MWQAAHKVFQLSQAQHPPNIVFAGAGRPISYVVADSGVEQHRILRHHTYGLAQAVLRHLGNILPIDFNATCTNVIKAEQESCQGRFARPARPNHCQGMACRDAQTDILEYLPARLIGVCYPTENDFTGAQVQLRRIRRVDNLGWRFQQAEQALDISQRLADFAVNKAQKVQRHKQLNHVRVDHHQLTDGHAATTDLSGGHHHHQGDRTSNNQGLTRIQRDQR